jgi:hypothetical protein
MPLCIQHLPNMECNYCHKKSHPIQNQTNSNYRQELGPARPSHQGSVDVTSGSSCYSSHQPNGIYCRSNVGFDKHDLRSSAPSQYQWQISSFYRTQKMKSIKYILVEAGEKKSESTATSSIRHIWNRLVFVHALQIALPSLELR